MITYSIHPKSWEAVRRPTKEAATDHYWTLRAYGLEGTVQISTGDGEVRWGGFILDLACGLAEWMANPSRTHTISPAEQSNDLIVYAYNNRVRIVSGGQAGELELTTAVGMVDRWLTAIALELRANAPRVLDVPGFDWALERASTR